MPGTNLNNCLCSALFFRCHHSSIITSPPAGCEVLWSACLSVCLPTRTSQKAGSNFANVLYVNCDWAWSSSDNNAIR